MKRIVREGGAGLWLPPARIEHWIDPGRQTARHIYDHAFGDGFLDEMYGHEDRVGPDETVSHEAIDRSFHCREQECADLSSDPAVWLPRLKAAAIEDGRELAWSLIPGHHRRKRTGSHRPLLALGLDGLALSVAEQLMAEGALPNLRALHEQSARHRLDHGDALLTGLAWEHFSIGRSPEDYGRHSAVDLDLQSYRVQQRGTRYPTFLNDVRAHTVVADVPYFDLAGTRAASGFTSWGAHDPGTIRESRPATLGAEIANRFGGYPGTKWIYGFVWPDERAAAEMAEKLKASVDLRTRITRWLLTERLPEWDLALVTAGELHSAIEALWHGIDPTHPLHGVASSGAAGRGVRAVYEATDRMVGELREARPDADLLLFSMHGMGANRSDVATMLLLPELLFRDAFGESAFTPSPDWTPDEHGRPMLAPGQDWSVAVNDRLRIPASVLPPEAAGRPVSNLDFMPAARYQPAWHLMDAFALPSFYDGRIRINLAGRERHGRVPVEGYESCRQRLVDLLMNCRDALTGESVVEDIRLNDRTAPLDIDPTDYDLSVRWSHPALGLVHPDLGTIGPAPHRRTGGHGGPGVAWIAAEGVVPGDHGEASSFDVVPTILQMIGERVPESISGRPLPAIGRAAEATR
jgi:predicted AlkP superfamily phosphohydrolase/phosphomutase